MQQESQRQLHHLEKIVAVFALLAVLLLTVGFAQAQTGKVFLRSSAVLVQDVESGKTILAKNSDQVMPIASITKLMTAMVLLDSGVDMQQRVVVSRQDIDHRKGTHSRLRPGTVLTRSQLLLLALMASENRAAFALARTYPGRHRGLRRGDEREGPRARHGGHALRRDPPGSIRKTSRARAISPGWSRRPRTTR